MNKFKNVKALSRILTITFFYMFFITPAHTAPIIYPDNSYATGNPLTAADLNTKFNEIKASVNDNDTRIGAATGTTLSGVDFASSSADITLPSTATPTTVMSVAITAPSAGFVIVSFSSAIFTDHITGALSNTQFWLATSPTPKAFDDTWRNFEFLAIRATGRYWGRIHSQKVFPVTAGTTTTFYARAETLVSSGATKFRNTTMIGTFVPNRY